MTSNGKFCGRLLRSLRSLIIAVAFCAVFAGCSQAHESKLSAEKRTQIEAAVNKFVASTHVPGVSIAIVENGAYEWGAGFGFADLENNVPASEHTLFRRFDLEVAHSYRRDATAGDRTSSGSLLRALELKSKQSR